MKMFYLVARADPRALADAILALRDQPELRDRLATGGTAHFRPTARCNASEKISYLYRGFE